MQKAALKLCQKRGVSVSIWHQLPPLLLSTPVTAVCVSVSVHVLKTSTVKTCHLNKKQHDEMQAFSQQGWLRECVLICLSERHRQSTLTPQLKSVTLIVKDVILTVPFFSFLSVTISQSLFLSVSIVLCVCVFQMSCGLFVRHDSLSKYPRSFVTTSSVMQKRCWCRTWGRWSCVRACVGVDGGHRRHIHT